MIFAEVIPMSAQASENELTEVFTELGFEQTVDRIEAAIRAAGMTVFATVDHAAAAADVGLRMPQTTVLFFGNPKGGTPIMLATPSAALDLPLKVLVRADPSGRTSVSFHPIALTLRRTGVATAEASRLAPAQQVPIDAIRA
jgi:uncharacterized protein (DUF302 family)